MLVSYYNYVAQVTFSNFWILILLFYFRTIFVSVKKLLNARYLKKIFKDKIIDFCASPLRAVKLLAVQQKMFIFY